MCNSVLQWTHISLEYRSSTWEPPIPVLFVLTMFFLPIQLILPTFLLHFFLLLYIIPFSSKLTRKQSLFANTHFTAACYHPSGIQIITTGTDCKIGYWEVYDGSLIRELGGSACGVLNGVDISRDGKHVLTGGNDTYVKVRHGP